MALISVDEVSFSYPGGVEVLDRLDFSLNEGEVVAVVGPSGCGKSTLLSILAGIRSPDSGEISWAPRQEDGPFGRRLSLLFQKDTVLPWRTVEKNVAFGPQNLGLGKSSIAARVDELLTLGGLEEFRKVYPAQLSGGMRRRLALLMAIAVRPEVLLLDEPFAAVDEPTRVGLHDDVLKLVYSYGISVILVTHDLAEAVSISDRLYVLSGRPTRVRESLDIPFGRARDVYSLRSTNAYNDLYRRAWSIVWSEKTASTPTSDNVHSSHAVDVPLGWQ